MLGNRSLRNISMAPFERRHYIALFNFFIVFQNPFNELYNYLFSKGKYPRFIKIKLKEKSLSILLNSFHDLITVCEIFCRKDYSVDQTDNVIIDIGSNIGIATIYFLANNAHSKSFCFEPNPNLKFIFDKNTNKFKNRIYFSTSAVSNITAKVRFGIEDTGRYGGINVKTQSSLIVDAVNINDILFSIFKKYKIIDILKIDVEGMEENILNAISFKYLNRIKKIYVESTRQNQKLEKLFSYKSYGQVAIYINNHDLK